VTEIALPYVNVTDVPRRRFKRGLGWNLLIYGVLTVLAVGTLIPFAYLICASLKTNADFFSSPFLPRDARGEGFLGIAWDHLTLEHFRHLFTELAFPRYLVNSIFLSSVTSVLATLGCAMGGYALAKFRFKGRALVTNLVLASLVIPGALLLALAYELLFHLHLLDTYTGMIIPAIAPAFGVYLFRQAMISGLPNELIESARIDGCGEIRMFFVMALPMVRPMIGAFMLITFLGTWNNFIGPQIVLQTPEKFPLAVGIAQLKGVYSQDYGMLMAGTLVSIAPVVVLFLLLQKQFIGGLTSGAVKG
jgi:ABC-type glycerol-3-phosphate transport system permease component